MNRTDTQLIDDYRCGSQAALSVLIRRHVDLVYAAALRHTGDPGTADDVTQAVFIILSKKAHRLRPRSTVAGWLIVVTRHVSRAAIRSRNRRQRHERAAACGEAVTMSVETNCAHWELSRILDDALAGLSSKDRDAIVLRYLQSHSFVGVGQMLGISEEAARKRVDRGITRLRVLLARHSVLLEATAVSEVIAKFAPNTAPADVVQAISQHQMVPISGPAVLLSNEVLRMFLFRKIGVAIVMIALMIGAVAGISVRGETNTPTIAAAPATQPALVLQHMVIQLGVRNLQTNIDYFERMGFHLAAEDANRPITWAIVESGGVRFRMFTSTNIPRLGNSFVPYFYIEGGLPALQNLHDEMASHNINVREIDLGWTPRPAVEMRGGHLQPGTVKGHVISFDVRTPDGYVIGFNTVNAGD